MPQNSRGTPAPERHDRRGPFGPGLVNDSSEVGPSGYQALMAADHAGDVLVREPEERQIPEDFFVWLNANRTGHASDHLFVEKTTEKPIGRRVETP